MSTENDQQGMGPYVRFNGLPPLHRRELDLPRIHPYEDVAQGRYLTPGGGRLTIETSTAHHRITLDHLGCDAQTTLPKEEAFKRLALASEGRCTLAGCTHRARYSIGNVYRTFQARTDWVTLTAFVRALLAIELGHFAPTDALATQTTTAVGRPPRRPTSHD
ncbi:DUF6420 family protein [Streptomyces diastaticus]|uniref:DUF6420 family protein n=1 Tax=Streptomyces TaxID=1883 RepID=UPI000FBD629F|nr:MULTISPECIES: DUF6420 family protein [unclassified Streptomyces]MBL3806608.1 hypothetical protein [Streptomyces sp. BRB081]RPK79439.1 hypothetical protein EES47_29455 [Streptomyces sp. ADI98-12]